MWEKIGIGAFLIGGTALITAFFMGLSMFMEWVYGRGPWRRRRRGKTT